MAMITAGDFRNGVTFEMDGKVMQVVEFQHVKPGKGAAFVRTKMKNVITGAVTETSFNPTAKFEQAFVDRKEMEYSYNDGDLYYFMDMETYDMLPVNKSVLGDNFKFVKENMSCKIMSYKGSVFGVEPPNFVDLEVTDLLEHVQHLGQHLGLAALGLVQAHAVKHTLDISNLLRNGHNGISFRCANGMDGNKGGSISPCSAPYTRRFSYRCGCGRQR